MVNGGAVPKAGTLREKYVPMLYEKQRTELREYFSGCHVAVIADETTNTCQRYVLNILAVNLDTDDSAKLIATVFLGKVNHSTVPQEIVKCLTDIGIDFNDVLAVVSDNAQYMKKVFQTVLSNLLPNAVHVTCWAHTTHLAVEAFWGHLGLAHVVVATGKIMFVHAPARRRRWLEHLRSQGVENSSMPTEPVVTRWGTWLSAASYYSGYSEHLSSFVGAELECSQTATLSKLRSALQDPCVESQLRLAATWASRFNKLIDALESRKISTPVVYNKMMDLLMSIKADADLDNTGALAAAAAKLDGGKQPGLNFFKAVRLLVANQFHLLRSTFDFIKSSLPMLSDMRT